MIDRSDGPLRPDPSNTPSDEGPEPPDEGPGLPDEVRRFLARGVLLFPVLVLVLWTLTSLTFLDALLLAVLVELLPVLAVAQVPMATAQDGLDRPGAYAGSAAATLFLGWMSLTLGEDAVGFEAMGVAALSWEELLMWTGVALGAGMAVVGLSHLVEGAIGWEESDIMKEIVPRTGFEKSLFAGVSLSAGLGEELAYRSYLIPLLSTLVGSSWAAAVLSSGVFGFLHAYQGTVGVVRTAVLGFALAAVFLASGSIWPVIVAHTVIDLIGGLVLGPRLLEEGG